MRINTFRNWLTHAVQGGLDRAARVAHAVARRVRQSTGRVDASAGVGGDEPDFRGGGSRAWLETAEAYAERILRLFERSVFERFPRLERFLRRFMGLPERKAPLPRPLAPRASVHTQPVKIDPIEAERLAEEVRIGRIQALTTDRANRRQRELQEGANRETDADTERD